MILINCKNEPIYGYDILSEDYNIIKYEAKPWHISMELDYINTFNDFISFNKNKQITPTLSKNVMSLLCNWKNMLIEYINEPDDTVFGESDIYPASYIDWDMIPWDDYDVFRPFQTLQQNIEPEVQPTEIKWNNAYDVFNDWKKYGPSWCKVNCGTHALIIPKNKREKLIYAFKKYKQPSDIALRSAVMNKEIKMANLNYNAFKQHPHRSMTATFRVYTG